MGSKTSVHLIQICTFSRTRVSTLDSYYPLALYPAQAAVVSGNSQVMGLTPGSVLTINKACLGSSSDPSPHWPQSTTCDGTTTHSCTRQPTSVRHLPGSARKTVVAPNHSVARTLSLNWGCYHFIDCLH